MRNETSDASRLRAVNGPFGWAGLCICFGLMVLLWSYSGYQSQTSSHLSKSEVVAQLTVITQLDSMLRQMGSENVEGVKNQLVQGISDRISVLGGMLQEADGDTRDFTLQAVDRIARFYKAHPDYYTESHSSTNQLDYRVAEAIQHVASRAE